MPKEAESIVFVAVCVMLVACNCLWLFGIRPYLKRSGIQPSTVVLSTSILTDYKAAKIQAKSVGCVPWFLRAFEIGVCLSVFLLLSLLLGVILEDWR